MKTNPDKTDPEPKKSGESMKDSMAESAPDNDNSLLPTAEDLTNKKGELDPEKLKEQQTNNINYGRQ